MNTSEYTLDGATYSTALYVYVLVDQVPAHSNTEAAAATAESSPIVPGTRYASYYVAQQSSPLIRHYMMVEEHLCVRAKGTTS